MKLDIVPETIEFIYDELDTNALNFRLVDGYFSIQTGVCLEEDEELNKPQFELNDQGESQFGGLEKVVFFNDRVDLEFAEATPFIGKYTVVQIDLGGQALRKIVDFFANHLFFGRYIGYADDFSEADKVTQTRHPDPF